MRDRRRSVALLVAAALLFVGWLAWLAHLAFTAGQPVVLSRPQFLAARLDVSAELTGPADRPDDRATVVEVLWSRNGALQAGQKIDIVNLSEATRLSGWQGPGRYLLPLVKGPTGYRIAPVLRSPGFAGSSLPRIYRDSLQTRDQERRIRG